MVTVRCQSAIWAAELSMLSGELLERLNEASHEGGVGCEALKFVIAACNKARKPVDLSERPQCAHFSLSQREIWQSRGHPNWQLICYHIV